MAPTLEQLMSQQPSLDELLMGNERYGITKGYELAFHSFVKSNSIDLVAEARFIGASITTDLNKATVAYHEKRNRGNTPPTLPT